MSMQEMGVEHSSQALGVNSDGVGCENRRDFCVGTIIFWRCIQEDVEGGNDALIEISPKGW